MKVLTFLCLASVFLCAYSRRHVRPTKPRIVGGHDVDIEDYPFQVSVLLGGQHACGGSIISERFILTAAHCTFEETEDDISVRVGTSTINSGGRIVHVIKIHQHESFDYDTMDFDISILELEDSLDFQSGVQKIQLIGAGDEVPSGQKASATGWGRTSYNGPVSKHLQEVIVPTISTRSCQDLYGSGPDGITDNMFCAGEEGKDTCQGDSGGPLVVEGIQIGITSWGDICGKAATPGVYTKISQLRGFIDQIVN